MAKENLFFGVGQIINPLKIEQSASGEISKISMRIETVKRDLYDATGALAPKHDYPLIVVTDKHLISVIKQKNIQQYDIIEVKGIVATKNVDRRQICPHCNQQILRKGVLDYVYPVYLNKRVSLNTKKDAVPYMLEAAEISNIVRVSGKVCQEVKFYVNENNSVATCNYNIALNRKLYIPTQPEITADYPWVKSYGEQAEADHKALKLGSLVYIDGYLKTEQAIVKGECPNCGGIVEFPQYANVIRPYAVEYFEGCFIETDEKAQEKGVI